MSDALLIYYITAVCITFVLQAGYYFCLTINRTKIASLILVGAICGYLTFVYFAFVQDGNRNQLDLGVTMFAILLAIVSPTLVFTGPIVANKFSFKYSYLVFIVLALPLSLLVMFSLFVSLVTFNGFP